MAVSAACQPCCLTYCSAGAPLPAIATLLACCSKRRFLAGAPSAPPAAPAVPASTDLAAYARQQWEALLLYLVDSAGSAPPAVPAILQAPGVDVAQLLAAAGLMLKDEYTLRQSESALLQVLLPVLLCHCMPACPPGHPRTHARAHARTRTHARAHTYTHAHARAHTHTHTARPTDQLPACPPTSPPAGISERGFQFLLSDVYSQLWSVVRQYLSGLGAAGDLAVAINFLLRLGLQAGQPVCYSQLAHGEQAIAAHMAQLGLLMPVVAAGSVWLHPTRLATVLAGGGRAGEAAAASEDGFVIVESNFRCVPCWL